MNPCMSHLTSKDYKQIYEPSDDTWLFVDALEYEKNALKDRRICLEIGSGSGYVSAYLNKLGGECGRQVIDQFLPRVKNLLSNDGIFYMILIQENKPEEVIDIMSRPEYGGFYGQIIRKKKVLGEILFVTKFMKIKRGQ
ncbi:hypothetical protein AKO1_008274 [Acrasis kona]|uniref:Uncharacterized protein n=1 Tax=Acrasis kona TaxID=1008807 RepID=A0AAW2YP18_9EUKA